MPEISAKATQPEFSPVTAAAGSVQEYTDVKEQPGLSVQLRLAVGAVDDPMEREADDMADQVMRMPEPTFIQRKCAHCEEEEKAQRKPLTSFIQKKGNDGGTTASAAVSQQINATRGSGSAMDTPVQRFMESRFGADFSAVKIHTGATAVQLSRELNAQAFTVGSDIYFNEGKYNPSSSEGKHLLAHELTHTVQQQGTIERKVQRMLACPPRLSSAAPVPAGFKPYYGNSHVFHCGFRGILEDRRPTPDDPMNECFYDDTGTLVTESHPFAGCRGTPDYYDSETEGFNHFANDPGGVVHAGGPALLESAGYPILNPLMNFTSYLERSIRQLYGVP